MQYNKKIFKDQQKKKNISSRKKSLKKKKNKVKSSSRLIKNCHNQIIKLGGMHLLSSFSNLKPEYLVYIGLFASLSAVYLKLRDGLKDLAKKLIEEKIDKIINPNLIYEAIEMILFILIIQYTLGDFLKQYFAKIAIMFCTIYFALNFLTGYHKENSLYQPFIDAFKAVHKKFSNNTITGPQNGGGSRLSHGLYANHSAGFLENTVASIQTNLLTTVSYIKDLNIQDFFDKILTLVQSVLVFCGKTGETLRNNLYYAYQIIEKKLQGGGGKNQNGGNDHHQMILNFFEKIIIPILITGLGILAYNFKDDIKDFITGSTNKIGESLKQIKEAFDNFIGPKAKVE